jgi:FkbM family methyltransferase
MKKIYRKVQYHVKRILFEKYAIPNVINESISKELLKKFLPVNPVIIDCGAHDGSDSVALAKLFKTGTVHSFEPVDELFGRLKLKTSKYKNAFCYNLALADKNGWMDFYVSEGASDASSSLLEPMEHLNDHPSTFFKKKISVPTITLDSWAAENNIARIDMLWLDMQGFELNMLQSSESILDTVSVIHTEVSTKQTYKGVVQYDDYRSFLESEGFVLEIEAIPEGWDMGNALFVRKRKG